MQIAQQIAADAVSHAIEGANLHYVLSRLWRAEHQLLPSQRGASQDLSYGTLRYYGELDAILQQLMHQPITDALLRSFLLVVLYQLRYTKATAHTIVNQAVEAVAGLGHPKARGLVNAILRNYLRDADALVAKAHETEIGHYNHQAWWIEKLKSAYPNDWASILTAGNTHPPMTIRVNPRVLSHAAYGELLDEAGIAATALANNAWQITQPMPSSQLPLFSTGGVSVQDMGAQAAAHLLPIKDGMTVLDACAAPGGKTAHLLEKFAMQLTVLDKDEERLESVHKNLTRLNLWENANTTVKLMAADAANLRAWHDGNTRFDAILLDAPCSASGVVRRHPDAKWSRRPTDIAGFVAQQRRLLHALWPLLADGGHLLYATCSVFPAENSDTIAWFLDSHKDAKEIHITANDAQGLPWHTGQSLPNHDHDGFFYALLQKQSSAPLKHT